MQPDTRPDRTMQPGSAPAGGGWRLVAAEELAERHRAELDRDVRVERQLAWRELASMLLVAVFLLVRARYLD